MKRAKTYLLAVAFTVVISVFPNIGSAFENEPDEFRGIKWGTNIKDLGGFVYDHSEASSRIYRRENDKMMIGDAVLSSVLYQFYKGRFCGVLIKYKGRSNFISLKKLLFETYGKPHRPKQFMENYSWFGASVFVGFKYSEVQEKGHIFYAYRQIWEEIEADEKRQAEM